MSLAVNLGMKLAEMAAKSLRDKDADVEILERHHRFKEDAPSGNALRFGRIIAEVMGQSGHRHEREGRPGVRPHAEIGYHAIRVGDNPGEHTIVFAMLGEMIELTVRATSRDCYVPGACRSQVPRRPPAGDVWNGRRPRPQFLAVALSARGQAQRAVHHHLPTECGRHNLVLAGQRRKHVSAGLPPAMDPQKGPLLPGRLRRQSPRYSGAKRVIICAAQP